MINFSSNSLPPPDIPPSERSFGFLFTIVFVGLGCYGAYKGWSQVAIIAWLTAGFIVALLTLFAPRFLSPFKRAWLRLGVLLGNVVSPIALGIIFFGLLTPISFAIRLIGRDELRLKKKPAASYWIERLPPGPTSDSFRNQF